MEGTRIGVGSCPVLSCPVELGAGNTSVRTRWLVGGNWRYQVDRVLLWIVAALCTSHLIISHVYQSSSTRS